MTKEAGSKSELLTLFDDKDLFDVGLPGDNLFSDNSDSPFKIVKEIEDEFAENKQSKKENTQVKKPEEEELVFNVDDLGKKEVKDTDEGVPQKNNDNNLSTASIFATFLLEKGALTSFDENEFNEVLKSGDEEALTYLYEKEVESRYSEAKKQLSEDKEEIVAYFDMLDSGVDPNEAKPLAYEKKKYSSIKESELDDNETLRKDVLNMYFKSKGLSQKDTERAVKALINSGEDIEAAKDSLKELNVSIEKRIKEAEVNAKKEYEANQAARAEALNKLHLRVDSVQELYGNKINKQTHTKLKEFLTPVESNGKIVDGLTNWLLKDPDNRIRLAYLIQSGIADGDLSKITNAKKTSIITELERTLKDNKGTIGEGKHTMAETNKPSTLDALVNTMNNSKTFPKKN